MNFNNDTGVIDTIQQIDTTALPPLGGIAGVLTIIGTGAVAMPSGTTAQQPATATGGMLRYNNQNSSMEFFNGTQWSSLSSAGGTVSSITVTTGTGLLVSGGTTQTIGSSGTFALTLNSELQGLAGLASLGLVTRTAAGTYTESTITGTAGTVTVTNGNGVGGSPTIDLATLGTPVTSSFVKITTDAYGRVSSTTPVTGADVSASLGYTPVNKAGDTMTGPLDLSGNNITNLANPVNAQDAATKYYVDTAVTGLSWKDAVVAATVSNLTATYSNGTSGVGATLTNSGAQAAFAVDGYTASVNDRVLIKNQTDQTQNGIYTVTNAGSASTNWVLTRTPDSDTQSELLGATVYVEQGTTNQTTGWVQTTSGTITVGTTGVVWAQFSGAGSYAAGTGLTLTGNVFSITTPVSTAIGGTGLTSVGTSNQILGVNAAATALEYKTIDGGTSISIANSAGTITINNTGVTSNIAGTGISVSGATGSVTITNTGVLSVAGTANQIDATTSTGAVTLSLPAAVTIPTSLTISGLTPNSFLYSGAAGLLTTTTAPTNGQLLIGSTGNAPVAATLTQGTGVTIANGAGSIIITNSGVTSLTAGTGIGVSAATGNITVTNTGVTSVALTAPSIFTVTGSPVTTTGTFDLALATQAANTVFAGPTTGTAIPTFRTLTYTDLPLQLYAESATGATAPVASGTNSVAIGTGATADGVDSTSIGNGTGQNAYGSVNYASGSFATAGDAQRVEHVLRAITTTSTPTQLWLDGAAATQNLVIPNNSTMTFEILVVGRRTDATGGAAGYRFLGVINKDATASSITFIGKPSRTVVGETNSSWTATISADTATGSLIVTVTGENAKTIRWVATVTGARVTN